MPYAPRDREEWTTVHYELLYFAELAIGTKKEADPQEKIGETLDELMEAGDENWLEKVEAMIREEGYDGLDIDEDFMNTIPEE